MLHTLQSSACMRCLRTKTGMCLNTHSIDKLFRYGCMTCYRLPEIFPRSNDKEERLFICCKKRMWVDVMKRSIPSLYVSWKRYGVGYWN